MSGKPAKTARQQGAQSPMQYEASFNKWIGGKAREFREFTADLAQVAPGERVLDLGCGTGELAMRLAQRVGPAGRVAGIDAAEGLIAGARRKAKRAGLAIDYQVGLIEQLPFPDASVDVVVSSLVMHHLAPDILGRTVKEIRRVMKPGGRVFIIDFQSLDQAGRGLDQSGQQHASRGAGANHSHHHSHDHSHAHDHTGHHGQLHDHRPVLVSVLKEAGFTDAHSANVEFGQRLEVTRGRLAG